MSGVNSATVAQQETLTLTRTVELNTERSAVSLALSASSVAPETVPSDSFKRVFDVIDISQEAQEELLRNKQNADALIEYVRRGRGIEIRVIPPRPGKVEIGVSAESVKESFSYTETLSLKFSNEKSVEFKAGDKSISVESNQSVELSLSRTVEYLSSSSSLSLTSGLGAQA